jgi:hypothetical protein
LTSNDQDLTADSQTKKPVGAKNSSKSLAGAEGASTEEYAVNLIKGLRKISKAEIFD